MKLGELKANFEESKVLIEKQETTLRYYETRAQKITIAYLIWERLFFFAVSQTSSALKCVDWGAVLALSLSCTFVYFLFLLQDVIMLYRTQYQLEIICKEHAEIGQRILVARNQDDGGLAMEAGDLIGGIGFSFSVRILKYDSFRILERKVYICSTACALLAVTAIELYAFSKYLISNSFLSFALTFFTTPKWNIYGMLLDAGKAALAELVHSRPLHGIPRGSKVKNMTSKPKPFTLGRLLFRDGDAFDKWQR